jgi:hypothetical protein
MIGISFPLVLLSLKNLSFLKYRMVVMNYVSTRKRNDADGGYFEDRAAWRV